MLEHKFNNEQLKKYLEDYFQKNIDIKEEIIEEVKKSLEDEGLYQSNSCEIQKLETNEEYSNSRKISESSNERKNDEYFLEEFHKNLINEINYCGKIGSEELN